MCIRKQYLKNGLCSVTLSLPGTKAVSAKKVSVLGDFNGWNREANPMNHLKNGSFKLTLKLEKDHTYQFRYLINDKKWENDPEADEQVPNYLGDRNSLIHV